MKNFAKLTLFFSSSFIIIFITAILLGFVSSWNEYSKIILAETRSLHNIADLAWGALPAALYLSILLTSSYSARRKTPIFKTIIFLIILSLVFSTAVSFGVSRTETLKPFLKPVSPIQAEPGLILSRGDNAIILLKESSYVRGPRVVSIRGQPLIYQEVPLGPNNTIITLPEVPFEDITPWFIKSINIDFSISARELQNRMEDNYLSFAVYLFALALLLSSLRFLMELSQWPLANIFLGALVFRLILVFETFINAREINSLIFSFLGKRVPPILITPLVLTVIGILIIVYTLLTNVARQRRRSEN